MNPPPVNTSALITQVFLSRSHLLQCSNVSIHLSEVPRCDVIKYYCVVMSYAWDSFPMCKETKKPQLLPQVSYPLLVSQGSGLERKRGDTFASLTDGSLFLAFSLPLSLPHCLDPKHRHRHTRLHQDCTNTIGIKAMHTCSL